MGKKEVSSPNKEKISQNYEKALQNIIVNLASKYNFSKEDIQELTKEAKRQDIFPITLFQNRLSPLELIIRYLKQEKNLRFSQIAKILNRNERTIWGSYNKSLKKLKTPLIIKPSNTNIPLSIFSNRKFSILESLTAYLKEKENLNFRQIGELIIRNERTIWTVYSRLNKKRGKR